MMQTLRNARTAEVLTCFCHLKPNAPYYNSNSQDVIVIAVTLNTSLPNSVLITNDDLVEGFLKTNSCAKVDSVLKIHQSLIIKNIGRISVEKYKRIITKFDSLIELEIDQIEKEIRSNNQNVD